MPQCSSCGVDAGLLRGGRCKLCHQLHLSAKAGDRDAAKELADRGKDLPKVEPPLPGIRERASKIDVTTETVVHGVVARLGVVTGQCALGMNIFRDFTSGIRDLVGGRSGAYQKAIKEAKDHCISDMRIEAAELDADAIVAMDLDFSEISGGGMFGGRGMIMVIATGTAVKMDRSNPSS